MTNRVTVDLVRFTQQLRAAQRPPDLYLTPQGILTGITGAVALQSGLAATFGPGQVFSLLRLTAREAGESGPALECLIPVAEFEAWLGRDCPESVRQHLTRRFQALKHPPLHWAGLALIAPLVMGIVNVTPDSFSDGGDNAQAEGEIAHGRLLMDAGADIIDIGGESTRPGAKPVPPEIEIARVVPVVTALAREGAVVSIDTRHAAVMAAALDAGARIINDVSALQETGALDLAIARKAPVVLMHMPGNPQTMQTLTQYRDPALDVWDFLKSRLDAWEAAGGDPQDVMIDPGIGFGKTMEQNIQVLGQLGMYRSLGAGILLGVSRKRLIEQILETSLPARQRCPGSIAIGLDGVGRGANILRVHDVAETIQGLRSWQAIRQQA